jgi:hypothetical protein
MDIETRTFKSPIYAGGYRIGKSPSYSVTFDLVYKPKLIHILFCKLLLGWEWIDNK